VTNGSTTGDGAEQTYKHRARDAMGFGGLAALHKDFDKPRCREASRPAGPVRTLASRAPSVLFSGQAVLTDGVPGADKECGRRSYARLFDK
jgi:hypothetical protein